MLGSVFLAVTGAEALYADMGHFGRWPIQPRGCSSSLPCLVFNYLGQGALVAAATPGARSSNPFFLTGARTRFALPLVILATVATIIASPGGDLRRLLADQQAIQLGFLPRMRSTHTSATDAGRSTCRRSTTC